ncbi:type VI secretion system tip protein VgrG, partial [Pseudomonas chlororaphis]|nr:type VI secretion system tip protein VgrG [Pseudomonas chlororaphis]MCO7592614.1 type VI secretion system tip protein VgrG [Pseudomonas chlororaphis]
QAGGSFIKLDASGVSVSGALLKVNAGGAAGQGSGAASLLPVVPLPAATAKAGTLLERGPSQPAPEVIHRLSAVISPLPGVPGYEDEPYQLFADGALIQQGLTGADGLIRFEHVPGTQAYAVELINGHRFEIEPKDQSDEPESPHQPLARRGYRDYQGQVDQLEALNTKDDYRMAALNPVIPPKNQ